MVPLGITTFFPSSCFGEREARTKQRQYEGKYSRLADAITLLASLEVGSKKERKRLLLCFVIKKRLHQLRIKICSYKISH